MLIAPDHITNFYTPMPTTNRFSPFLLIFLLGLFSACNSPEEPAATAQTSVDLAAEAEVIMGLDRLWVADFAEGDIEGIMSYHATNAIQMPPGAPPVVGAEAVRARLQGMIDTEGLEVTWEPTEVIVAPSGDMAYDYGTLTITTPDGVVAPMKYAVVWVHENGEWKVAVDMWNSNASAE